MSERTVSTMVDRTRPVVKICGLTRIEDVLVACDLGVWALGFVFAPSPRRLNPERAEGLVDSVRAWRTSRAFAESTGSAVSQESLSERARAPLTVGVFMESTAEEIAAIVRQVGLDGVQLHGTTGARPDEVRSALADEEASLLIIQAVPVDAETRSGRGLRSAVQNVSRTADIVLLDTRAPSQSESADAVAEPSAVGGAVRFGGSGRTFPWHLARQVETGAPLLVAGGIGPHNARAALAESGAWGIDVSSGVESAPGIKDAFLMEELVTGVREGAGT